MILSEQSGEDYHHLIQARIAKPLGLQDSGVTLDEEQQSRLATGYRSYLHLGPYYLAQQAASWNFPNCLAAAGGLRSTASDMLVFLKANMGQLSSDLTPVLQQSHQPLFATEEIQIGMGWFHDTLPTSDEPIIWHNGGTGGYRSFIGFTANGRFGVCVLSNSTRSVDTIGYTLLENLIAERPMIT
jgi:CubicO group peptidase (beta-lactamase class C family)